MPNLKEMSSRTKKFIIVQGVVLVVFAIAAIVGGNALVNRPETCTFCHEMTDPIKAWQDSSHEKVACVKCHHKEEGYYGFVIGIPKKLTEGIKHVTGEYSVPVKAHSHTEDKVCQRCHVSWRDVSPSGDLIVPHNLHFEKRGIACSRCHSRVVHGETLDRGFFRKPTMQLCLTCHGGGAEGAPVLQCMQCHTEKGIPPSHRQKDWFVIHSKVQTDPSHPDSDCDSCHKFTVNYCADCHKNNLPSTHYGGTKWRTYHKERGKISKGSCLVCHDKQNFCYKCHDPFED